MNTIAHAGPKPLLDRRFWEHKFFLGISLLILATIWYGFARSYFLAGVLRAPLPNSLVHIHGAVMSSWIFLLVIQSSLVAAKRVDWHRRLGVAGFLLACLVVVVGSVTVTDAVFRKSVPPGDPLTFYYAGLSQLLGFAVFVYLAFRSRSNPVAHKRLIMLATLLLIDAGIARWPIRWISRNELMMSAVVYSFLLLIATFDWLSRDKVHPVTIWGGGCVILLRETQRWIGPTRVWHSVAQWLLGNWHGWKW